MTATQSIAPTTSRELDLDGTEFKDENPGVWRFDTSAAVTSRNVREHVEYVLRVLGRFGEAYAQVRAEGRSLSIDFVGQMDEPLPEPGEVYAEIGSETLSQLERLGLGREAISWRLTGR